MNILYEVLQDYPTPLEKEFREQFSDWSAINEHGFIDPVDLKLKELSSGADRIVYATKHPQILLKAAFGPQEMTIPDGFEFLYLNTYEFEFPVPLQDPCYEEGRPFGQFQLKIIPYRHFLQRYMRTRALQKKVQNTGCDIGFALSVVENYSEEVLLDWLETFRTNPGMRAPSSQNWGYLNSKPVIFDYGRIIE